MITEYKTRSDFWKANRELLNTAPDLTAFFKLDSPLLKETNRSNYALKCENGGNTLLALKIEPFNCLLFGDAACAPELLSFIMNGGYELKHYLSESTLGDAVLEELEKTYGLSCRETLAMDYLEAEQQTEPSSAEVLTADESDLDEICECLEHFITDCGLHDTIDRKQTKKTIGSFRLIRKNGEIVSMARMAPAAETAVRIVAVYTRDAYRGKGYARKVVNTLKNEILSAGRRAVLNVDRNNPISYHLYASLGFRRVFSQGEYRISDPA